ncbi:hypothetical protein ACFL1B_05825 [Nanoarchaeota archaeon]
MDRTTLDEVLQKARGNKSRDWARIASRTRKQSPTEQALAFLRFVQSGPLGAEIEEKPGLAYETMDKEIEEKTRLSPNQRRSETILKLKGGESRDLMSVNEFPCTPYPSTFSVSPHGAMYERHFEDILRFFHGQGGSYVVELRGEDFSRPYTGILDGRLAVVPLAEEGENAEGGIQAVKREFEFNTNVVIAAPDNCCRFGHLDRDYGARQDLIDALDESETELFITSDCKDRIPHKKAIYISDTSRDQQKAMITLSNCPGALFEIVKHYAVSGCDIWDRAQPPEQAKIARVAVMETLKEHLYR